MRTRTLMMTLAIAGILAACVGAASDPPDPKQGGNAQPPVLEPLTEIESAHILHMREEEKLARDVYLTFAEMYDCPVFARIAASEQRHMDAVGLLVIKHGLDDPIVDDTPGAFSTELFSQAYTDYITTGAHSLLEALKVGVAIEELDIADLEQALQDTEKGDITWVFENLLRGSSNHLRAFTRHVAAGGTACTLQDGSGRSNRAGAQADGPRRGRVNGNRRGNGSYKGDCPAEGCRQQNRDGTCQNGPAA